MPLVRRSILCLASVLLMAATPAFAHGNAPVHFSHKRCGDGQHYQAVGKGSMRTGSCVAN